MDTITFVVHPEWIKKEERTIYRDLCAAVRTCVSHLQYKKPEWNIVVIRCDERTLTVTVKSLHSLEFVENIYDMTGEIVHLNAIDWLRMSEYDYLAIMPDLAEPPPVKDARLSAEHTNQSDYLDDLCHLPVMKEYPMLADCLRTQAETIRMLKKMGLVDCAWEQNLLVAMDDDADFEKFMEALYKVYNNEEMIAPVGKDYTSLTTVTSWGLAVSNAEKFSFQSPQKHTDILLIIDVRRAGFEQGSQNMREELQTISRMDKNFLCIFRTRVQEMDLIERMIDDINDVMPVRAVIVPPAGPDVLTACFVDLITEMGCTFSQNCDDLVERWFVQECNVAGCGGYELVKRLSRELVLHKARSNVKTGISDKIITPEDIRQCMGGVSVAMPIDARKQLESIIGVAEIKQRVLEIAAQIKVQRELAEQGVERPAVHMMFTGNPGTGKTMVARIIASILREEGILSKGHLYEVNARDLCAQHIGHTAPRVTAKCRDAYGSVLFVDEAYTLYQEDSERDFGQEAIATLMTEMENHRDDFCVILAGYPDDMERLMTANSGLRSRIPYTIRFPNYSRDELMEIFFQMVDGHFDYDDSLKTAAGDFFRSIPDNVMESSDFSNARMVRNLYERVWGKAAYRKVLNNECELVLRGEDLAAAVRDQDFRRLIETPGKKRPIGFFY